MLNNFLVPRVNNFIARNADYILQIAAVVLLFILLVKALFDVDNHFDSWWYHLPWAARLVDLVPEDAYYFEPIAAARYQGFPLLPELLQGIFWRISGRVESANLVSFGSLVIFIIFLRYFFYVKWWIAVPALLAVPIIQAQATSTYVDLIANLAMTALVLLTYKVYVNRESINTILISSLLISALIAANSKLQLIPLVALTLALATYPAGKFVIRKIKKDGRGISIMRVAALLLVMSAIFLVPLKNILEHGNPVFPLRVVILGHVLNSEESPPTQNLGGGALGEKHQTVKWLYSVFEVGMGPLLNVKRWSLDSTAPEGAPLGIQGGLFGVYVVFNFLLFVWLVYKVERRERDIAVVFLLSAAIIAAVMPASHLLRYYMFWFVFLISLNLHFVSRKNHALVSWPVGAICFLFVLFVVDASDQNFVRPKFQSTHDLLAERVDSRILADLNSTTSACLALDSANQPFLYANIWHPGTQYSIKAGPFYGNQIQEVVDVCKGLKIIASPRNQ